MAKLAIAIPAPSLAPGPMLLSTSLVGSDPHPAASINLDVRQRRIRYSEEYAGRVGAGAGGNVAVIEQQ